MTNAIPTPPKNRFPKTNTLNRGDVWYVKSDPDKPAIGTEVWANRPGIIVSNDVLNRRSGFVLVIYLTTSQYKKINPTHVDLGEFNGRKNTIAMCEQIHTIDVSRLSKKIGTVSKRKMSQIEDALNITLSIDREKDHGLFRKWEEYIKVNNVDISKAIEALSKETADERVIALSQALKLVQAERDAYKQLNEASNSSKLIADNIRNAFFPNEKR